MGCNGGGSARVIKRVRRCGACDGKVKGISQ